MSLNTTMHEVLIELLQTDTAVFLADRPTLLELAQFIDGLGQVQATIDAVVTTACREFASLLEETAVRDRTQNPGSRLSGLGRLAPIMAPSRLASASPRPSTP